MADIQGFRCREAAPGDMPALLALSRQWEAEGSVWGLAAGAPEDFARLDVWVCEAEGGIIGYLSGAGRAGETLSVFPGETAYYEVEELYIQPDWRGHGAGKALYRFVEAALKARGVRHVLLQSATKDTARILRFYASLGFDPWTVRFFKTLDETE